MTSTNILLAVGLVFLLASNASAQGQSRAYAELKDKDGKSLMKPTEGVSDADIKGLAAYMRTFKK